MAREKNIFSSGYLSYNMIELAKQFVLVCVVFIQFWEITMSRKHQWLPLTGTANSSRANIRTSSVKSLPLSDTT